MRRALGATVDKLGILRILAFLVVATAFESLGDAIVRLGLGHHSPTVRALLFLAGTVLLFVYGLSLNLAPLAFGRVVGLYIAVLFVVWQFINLLVFRSLPTVPILLGGALIVAGGCLATFWKR
jgi:hypothetical protein